ncbi:hypothetical protein GWE18_41030 [Bradyrhizobium sp. CSA112]|uniref:hypothetical protein n=1 Tax=Bradyrhizobium sp. CSA112 TaxID=2699170 RepID=UPI0023B1C8DE|nr:hypothetical protein [Bradyrhizobium sp. CSA112]MDE5458981.1 hypothetical protein [Bradyrhizobium sp. CSA112]
MKTIANNVLSSAGQDAIIRNAMHREPELSNNEWKTGERLTSCLFRQPNLWFGTAWKC